MTMTAADHAGLFITVYCLVLYVLCEKSSIRRGDESRSGLIGQTQESEDVLNVHALLLSSIILFFNAAL